VAAAEASDERISQEHGMNTPGVLITIGAVTFLGAVIYVWEMSVKRLVERRMQARNPLPADAFGVHFFAADKAAIAARLRKVLQKHIDVDLARLHPDDRFIEDLEMVELDSLSNVNFAIAVEKEFAISIPDADAENLRTFREVVDYVAAHSATPAA
jgi:acyl carrier protein